MSSDEEVARAGVGTRRTGRAATDYPHADAVTEPAALRQVDGRMGSSQVVVYPLCFEFIAADQRERGCPLAVLLGKDVVG